MHYAQQYDLVISGNGVDDATLIDFINNDLTGEILSKIRHIRIIDSLITDEGIRVLLEKANQLRSLTLNNLKITDQVVSHITKLSSLHTLNLYSNCQFFGTTLKQLKQLQNQTLTSLNSIANPSLSSLNGLFGKKVDEEKKHPQTTTDYNDSLQRNNHS